MKQAHFTNAIPNNYSHKQNSFNSTRNSSKKSLHKRSTSYFHSNNLKNLSKIVSEQSNNNQLQLDYSESSEVSLKQNDEKEQMQREANFQFSFLNAHNAPQQNSFCQNRYNNITQTQPNQNDCFVIYEQNDWLSSTEFCKQKFQEIKQNEINQQPLKSIKTTDRKNSNPSSFEGQLHKFSRMFDKYSKFNCNSVCSTTSKTNKSSVQSTSAMTKYSSTLKPPKNLQLPKKTNGSQFSNLNYNPAAVHKNSKRIRCNNDLSHWFNSMKQTFMKDKAGLFKIEEQIKQLKQQNSLIKERDSELKNQISFLKEIIINQNIEIEDIKNEITSQKLPQTQKQASIVDESNKENSKNFSNLPINNNKKLQSSPKEKQGLQNYINCIPKNISLSHVQKALPKFLTGEQNNKVLIYLRD